MQYVFSMTSRMVTIVLGCALLLCVLLFALGVEIGARFVAPPAAPAGLAVSAAPAAIPAPPPTAFATPADNQMSAASPASDSSTN